MSKRDSTPQNSGTVLALLGMLLAFGALVALAAMVLPAVVGFLAVIFGIFLFGVLHYLLWGWWLGKPRRPNDET